MNLDGLGLAIAIKDVFKDKLGVQSDAAVVIGGQKIAGVVKHL